MEKLPVSLDTDALRSFVAGIDAGSFAIAARQLCRSTSAVSAQLKKLEIQCGAELVTKKGRHLQLTRSGEILIGYARRLLALNDEAHRAITGTLLQGEIGIGMQEDFGESLMPEILGQFSRHHPGVAITARIDRNLALLHAIQEHQLDMALIWQSENALRQQAVPLGSCPLEWIGHGGLDIAALLRNGEPLPLVMFEAPCVMRATALASLDSARIPWRVVFTSHSLSGIWAALQAGLGVTLRTRIGMPAKLNIFSNLLPCPGTLGIALIRAGNQPTEAEQLIQSLMTQAIARSTLAPAVDRSRIEH